MKPTRVVNVRSGEPYDLYIGRAVPRWGLKKSQWHNPFRMDATRDTREDVIAKYREMLLNSPYLMAALPELRGKVLACWCAPLKCHGDVLAELADQSRE